MRTEKSCPNCKEWNKTRDVNCVSCGEELFKKERVVREQIESQPDPFKIPFIKINSEDGYLMVFGKRIIQTIQLVFFGILSILIWFASILPG